MSTILRHRVSLLSLIVLLAIVTFVSTLVLHPNTKATAGSAPPLKHTSVTKVMAIGGSIAHGWKATDSYGFLQRAFATLSDTSSTQYTYYDRTIVGADDTQMATIYKGRYQTWLNQVKPQIVVISWGLLNDAVTKVPQAQFKKYLSQEIQLALNEHAVVFLVTPPVTRATYTQFKVQQPEYVRSEEQVVASFASPNVQMFNVLDQMEAYLTAHHQTYKPYMGDGWHPNTAGHILGGKILEEDIRAHYKGAPIVFA